MTTLSLFVAFCGLAYFLFMPRVFDWFSVAYVSACAYMLPVFVGYSRGAGGESLMHFEASLACLFVFVGILCGAVVLDTNYRRRDHEYVPSRWAEDLGLALTVLQCAGMINTFFISGDALWSTHKQEMFGSMTLWWLFWKTGIVAAFTFTYSNRMHRLTAINTISLLFLWYLGTRSPLTLSMFSVIVISISRRGPKPIIGNWKLGAASFCFAFIVLIYKQVYIFVKAGQWDNVAETLSSESVVSETLLTSEAMSQTHLLNVVISEEYRLPFGLHFWDNMVQSIYAGGAKSVDPSFGQNIANDLFPNLNYGLASNIWAEMFSTGGWPLFLAFLVIYVGVLGWTSSKVRSRAELPVNLICAWMPYWAFYIHRSDTYRLLSHFKQYAALLVICVPFVVVIRLFLRSGSRQSLRASVSMPLENKGVVFSRARH